MVSLFGIALYKLYNALSGFELYDFKGSIMGWILALIFYGLGLILTIFSYADLFILQLFKFMSLPLGLSTLFTFIEILMLAQRTTQANKVTAYKSNMTVRK